MATSKELTDAAEHMRKVAADLTRDALGVRQHDDIDPTTRGAACGRSIRREGQEDAKTNCPACLYLRFSAALEEHHRLADAHDDALCARDFEAARRLGAEAGVTLAAARGLWAAYLGASNKMKGES